jgi:hypothetical protein
MTKYHAAITAAQCRQLADNHNAIAKQTGLSSKRKSLLTNIARSLSGLASQLEMLDADMAEKSRQSRWTADTFDLDQGSASIPVAPLKYGTTGRKTAPK